MTGTPDETAAADTATGLFDIQPALHARLLGHRRVVTDAELIALSTRAGELRLSMPLAAAGAPRRIEIHSDWLGRVVLAIRMIACQDDGTASFEIVGRASAKRSAALLAATVDAFTFDHLRAAGVTPRRLSRYLTVGEAVNTDAFRAALDLRLQSNQHFGRLADVAASEQLVDRYDMTSVKLVACLGRKNIGTARVVVNNGDRGLSELEHECAPMGGLPQRLWDEGFVEASRVGVHPQYRGHVVFCALARAIGKTTLDVGARYVVLDSIDKLVPVYERLGAARLGITKKHQWSDETEHVMTIDIRESLGRIGRNAVYWQAVFGPLLGDRSVDTGALMHGLGRGGRAVFRVKRAIGRLQHLRAVPTI